MSDLIIFDTNTLVSASLFKQSTTRKAYDKVIDHFQFACSNECLDELKLVIKRPKFSKYIDKVEADEFVNNYTDYSIFFPVKISISDCRHPKDNKFLELAMSCNAKIIITGDSDLLVLHPYNSIKIITAKQFLDDDF